MDFPRLVYKSAAEHRSAASKEEFDLLRKEGWFASVPEALAKEHAVADEPAADEAAPPTRYELEAKAKELGIKFSKKTTDDELGRLITDALEV
jgi:hypothetical protein